jgi:hypothetical protein
MANGINPPTTMFGTSIQPRTQAELLSLANEMAQRIAYDTRDWTTLKKTHSFYGDSVWTPPVLPPDPPAVGYFTGGTTAFSFPADYKRLLLTANVWRSSSVQQPMKYIPDTDQWMHRRVRNEAGSAWGEWTNVGGQMHIYPVLRGPVPEIPMVQGAVPAEVAYFAYLDKNCIALASGGFGDVFMDDLDTFRLDERVLKLGMIWQWKAQKGSAYAEDLGTYGDALTNAMGHDSPAPIIIGDHRDRSYARYNQ